MTLFYYYLVLVSAGMCLAVAGAVLWKNRYQAVGPLFCVTMVLTGVWLLGFAQYFRPLDPARALWWANITLTGAILSTATCLHSMCALVGKMRRYRGWIAISYATCAAFLVLLWLGHLVVGVKQAPYMHHYIRYNRAWYPFLGLHIAFWQFAGVGILIYNARQAIGYKRTQLVYFIVAWCIIFLTTNSVILPLEYDIDILPFGFLLLPMNLAFLAYVMAKARLADFNVVIARVLLHTITLVVIVAASLLFIGAMTLVDPGFMNAQQILFTMMLVVAIGVALTIGLPRFLPRAERMMQERMFGKRYGYQDSLAGLAKELNLLSSIDEILSKVSTSVHSQMQVTRVLVLMQGPLAATYKVGAESGLNAEELANLAELPEHSPIIRFLQERKDILVRDELPRLVSAHAAEEVSAELDRLKVAVCVPMIDEARVVGVIGVGEKINREMFFVSDLRLLENLATEVALAVKYRHMEEQIFRKNRLIELGTIAAGVAHEIRNPLASIKTFAQLMPERMDDPEFKNEFSKLVQKDVDRITKVIESMLAFARPAQVTIGEHSTNDLVEEAILLVQPRLKDKRIELTRQFHGNPVIKVDRNQILQVLVNLLGNAADVLREQGKIRVATGVSQLKASGDGKRNQDYAVIEVTDNGPGIASAVRGRVFDPFFTTKKDGTGLGLSISQKIIRDHGGIITVSSIEGKGTSFQVNLPLK